MSNKKKSDPAMHNVGKQSVVTWVSPVMNEMLDAVVELERTRVGYNLARSEIIVRAIALTRDMYDVDVGLDFVKPAQRALHAELTAPIGVNHVGSTCLSVWMPAEESAAFNEVLENEQARVGYKTGRAEVFRKILANLVLNYSAKKGMIMGAKKS